MKYCLLIGDDHEQWGFDEEKIGVFDSVDDCLVDIANKLQIYRGDWYAVIDSDFNIVASGDFIRKSYRGKIEVTHHKLGD